MYTRLPIFPRSALWLLMGLACACGDVVMIVECPLGTMPEGSTCVPWSSDGSSTEPDAAIEPSPDVSEPPVDTPTFPMADVPVTDAPSDVSPPLDGQQTLDVPDAGPVGGGLGDPCVKNDDCDGGTCLDWPQGYCTSLDCDDQAPCEDGGACVPLMGGNRVCLLECQDDSTCNGPHQACKTLSQGQSASFLSTCHGIEEDASGVGGTCDEHTHCLGAASCLSTMPGGYCAVQGCGPGTCDAGSVCISYGGIATCLKECAVDEDCEGQPGSERRCGVLKALSGNLAGACISGASGAAVGEQCLNDFECASGTCDLLGEGQCSQTGAPCFESSGDVDCEPTEFCLVNGENGVGSCTQPCSLTAACPGAGLCEGQPGAAQGWCRAPCGGVGQDEVCRPETGFSCTFGFPIGETSGQGRYLCMRPREGAIGSLCYEDVECESGVCDKPPAVDGGEDPGGDPSEGLTAGLCTTACGDSLYCPFPTLCVASLPQGSCKLACLSVVDCPTELACASQPGGLSGICE
jgi:hypothetical protein